MTLKTRKRPNIPVIGLIGPTNLRRIAKASAIPEQRYRDAALEAGAVIARHRAILAMVPDRGIAMSGLQGYTAARGMWTIGLVPDGGPSDSVATPNCLENAATCDEVMSGFTWHHQHAALCELSDLMICLALRETFSAIPAEILAETDVVLIDNLLDLDAAVGRELKAAGKSKPDINKSEMVQTPQ